MQSSRAEPLCQHAVAARAEAVLHAAAAAHGNRQGPAVTLTAIQGMVKAQEEGLHLSSARPSPAPPYQTLDVLVSLTANYCPLHRHWELSRGVRDCAPAARRPGPPT